MGRLIDGVWLTDEDAQNGTAGRYERAPTLFRGTLTDLEPGRFVLWVADNCTWSQRLIIARNLLGLRDHISMITAWYRRDDQGWWFDSGIDEFEPDSDGRLHLWKVYVAADSAYSGRATVPVMWDRRQRTIVNNESSELLRQLNALSNNGADLVPPALRDTIDALNAWVYPQINNGVYRAGFAKTQAAYDEAVVDVFAGLDRCEALLAQHRYLAGDQLTEADVRLFPTLVRFDSVYHTHFRCSLRRLVDYPNLWAYTRDLYQTPGIGETVKPDIYKLGYMGNSLSLNPHRIIPVGPELDWNAPHGR